MPTARENGQGLQARRFAAYAWFVLAYNILVILWGAVVRATGSGAGCGEHWPLCQGVVIPHAAQIATLIEFAHRATSGVAVAFVLGLVFFGFRSFGSGHPVRRYAASAVLFTFTEGLLGAALVLAGLVGDHASSMRVFVLSLHLVNTLLLLASLVLTARSAAETAQGRIAIGTPPEPSARVDTLRRWCIAGLLGVMAVAVTGTIAALGDTLFPASSLAQGVRLDFSGSSNTLVRLRVIHPLIALTIGACLVVLAVRVLNAETSETAKRAARSLLAITMFQFVLGPVNMLLLTPLWTQILHLLTADAMWLTLVLLSAELFGGHPNAAEEEELEVPKIRALAAGSRSEG